ncbi:hypothetical protein P354_41500 [Streptomyces noursei PD-1]|uniref:Uncharacterized protein n=1 Tax=Streptomyces noursei TaxID=1971 RepID=A0A401QRJ4_STRNR|nr:hypothetical protein K530_08964 [Streptomyces noursei CCRC 11814]EXU86591.1 hypothetical protein P354_41500 [Streptomyces noursei PD-1]GCB88021.1 hypothetical protein SALB_00690 [Streptomyces noursei]
MSNHEKGGCDFAVPLQRADAGWALLPPAKGAVVDELVALAAVLNCPGESVFVDQRGTSDRD